MVGFNINRFVDLAVIESLVEYLKCSICLNIFDNAVDTKCRHTFCHNCINEWIQSNDRKECPECRQSMVNRKRTRSAANDDIDDNDVIIIDSDVLVVKNRRLNAIISKLKTKCDYEWNGCPEVMPLELLDTHLKTCQHKMCRTCGHSFVGNTREGHNCVEVLVKDRQELKTRVKELEEKLKKTENNYKSLESENNSSKEKIQKIWIKSLSSQMNWRLYVQTLEGLNQVSLDVLTQLLNICHNNSVDTALPKTFPDYVMFGTYGTKPTSIVVTEKGIEVMVVSPNIKGLVKRDIMIPFNDMQSLVHLLCNTGVLFISIKVNHTLCDDIQNIMHLGNNSINELKFDIKSNDPNEQNIVIVMKTKTGGQLIQQITDSCKLLKCQRKYLSEPMDTTIIQEVLTRLFTCIQKDRP